jgi:hypothetical protein
MRLKFVAGAALSSRLIEWFGFGAGGYSHVAAVLPSGELLDARSDQVGGEPPGVNVRPDGYEKWPRWIVVQMPATRAQDAAWAKFLSSQVGLPYDSAAIWAFALGEEPKFRKAWICSGFQTRSLQRAGIFPRNLDVPIEQVTPNALHEMCMANGGRVIDRWPR